MSAPSPSQLDFQQCIKGAFDEQEGRLRVLADLETTIVAPPGLEVNIQAVDDNIAIRNSTNNNELLINNDGSINIGGTPQIQANPNRFSISDFSQLISTTSIQILSSNVNRSFLFIQNSSKNKVWLDFNQNASQGFPSMQLLPGQILFMESTSITIDSIFAISEAINVPLIIKEG